MLAALALLPGCGDSTPDYRFQGKLRWAPPRLVDPEVVEVGAGGGTLRLDPRRDYRVVLRRPVSAVGGLVIDGGRNVVLIGGQITIPYAGPRASATARRGLLLAGQTGTVHVEGLLIDNSGGDLSEGIQIASPAAVVQLENIRVTGVHARDARNFTDNHPDLIQTWGGVRALRVHGFSGTTTYQGLFLRGDRGRVGRVTLSAVNIVGLRTARYLLWKRCRRPWPAPCDGPDFPLRLSNVWVRPAPRRSLRLSVKPALPADAWRGVDEGVPPGGDFVSVAFLKRRYGLDSVR